MKSANTITVVQSFWTYIDAHDRYCLNSVRAFFEKQLMIKVLCHFGQVMEQSGTGVENHFGPIIVPGQEHFRSFWISHVRLYNVTIDNSSILYFQIVILKNNFKFRI